MFWDDEDAYTTNWDAQTTRVLIGIVVMIALVFGALQLAKSLHRLPNTPQEAEPIDAPANRGRPRSSTDPMRTGLVTQLSVNEDTTEETEREVQVNIMEHRLRAPQRIKKMQLALKRAGFDPGPINGEFGPQTEAALSAFQQSFNLEPEGIEGVKTWAVLNHYVKLNEP